MSAGVIFSQWELLEIAIRIKTGRSELIQFSPSWNWSRNLFFSRLEMEGRLVFQSSLLISLFFVGRKRSNDESNEYTIQHIVKKHLLSKELFRGKKAAIKKPNFEDHSLPLLCVQGSFPHERKKSFRALQQNLLCYSQPLSVRRTRLLCGENEQVRL